jgi:hypothetical protein
LFVVTRSEHEPKTFGTSLRTSLSQGTTALAMSVESITDYEQGKRAKSGKQVKKGHRMLVGAQRAA